MKIVIDTNVFVSGVFFSGPPFEILDAWRRKKVTLIISPDILSEYQRIGDTLGKKFPGVDLEPWIELLMLKAKLVEAPPLPQGICTDPDDDKFLACAIASGTKLVVSGDKHLLDVSGYQGVTTIKPRTFVVACTPKFDPGVMRVSSRLLIERNFHEA
ncbi:MAG: putative toxin-antitoxin system toxin component, PIN family [bacterium]|nr:putative toxin-antitoxin system toxin component, PIN family [bacterium]